MKVKAQLLTNPTINNKHVNSGMNISSLKVQIFVSFTKSSKTFL